MSDYRHLFLCTGSTCAQQGAEESLRHLREGLQKIRNVRLTLCRCLGQCGNGPNMVIHGAGCPPEGIWYGRLTEEEVDRLMRQHLLLGKPLEDLLLVPVDEK
jgi:(2Fe-2S) ferredoxin